MLDDKCDTCNANMHITRSSKNSRFLVCRNPKCKRGSKNAAKDTPPETHPEIIAHQQPARARSRSFV